MMPRFSANRQPDWISPAPVLGGDTRQKSVFNGLEALARRPAVDRVLIHDAARPFVTTALIGRVIDALEDAPGAIPVIPISDTVKRVERDQDRRDRRPVQSGPRPNATGLSPWRYPGRASRRRRRGFDGRCRHCRAGRPQSDHRSRRRKKLQNHRRRRSRRAPKPCCRVTARISARATVSMFIALPPAIT